MALPASPGSPTVPSSLPTVGQSGMPGQPPAGPQALTQPTPNRGSEAAGLAFVGGAVEALKRALSMLDVASEPGQAVMKALSSLSKHVPPGSTAPGIENNAFAQLMNERKQNNPLIQLMRSRGQAMPSGIPPGGGGAAPPPAAAA